MNSRRNFLKMLVGGVAVAAAVPSFPFRVFSFPSEIKIAPVRKAYRTYILGENAMLTVADLRQAVGQLKKVSTTFPPYMLIHPLAFEALTGVSLAALPLSLNA